MSTETFVIVGGGLAAAEAAKTLRGDGFDGDIVIVGEEPHLPYERPELSKGYLRGETARTSLLVRDEDAYATERIEVRSGVAATELRLAESTVVLDGGRTVRFDALLLATGAAPRRGGLSDADLPGVHVLRTFEDADAIREAARTSSSAVVVGGGWIAAETAASLAQLGLAVSLVVPGSLPLERHVGRAVGEHIAALHRRHGVSIMSGSRVTGITGTTSADGVALADGRVVRGDLVVLGLGAAPRTELAAAAGLAVADGIVVDELLQTGAHRVFAAGDVASAWHPRYGEHVRSEHWDNARRQARTAARNMLGRREPYDRVPYVFSDQFEDSMELLGRRQPGDEAVLRRAMPDAAGLVAFWLADGRVVAGMHVSTPGVKRAINRLIEGGRIVDPRLLADVRVPLDDLPDAVERSAELAG